MPGQAGSAALDEASGLKEDSPLATHSAILISEGACWQEQYCVLVQIMTARDKTPPPSHTWVKALLNNFFRVTIDLPHMVIIISLTECLIFTPGCSKDLGMSFDNSLANCHTLTSVYQWVGSSVQVTALQKMVKEGQHDVAQAKEFTHEWTKERLAKPGCISCDATPEPGQYDPPNQDNLDKGLTSQLDPNSEEEDTDMTGRSGRSTAAEHNCRRNCVMCRERACAKHDFRCSSQPHGRKLLFSLFWETDRDNSISYWDWHAEIEAMINKEYDSNWVKTAMFEAMEGMAKDHAANIDQYGVLTALEILEGMDQLYSILMTFQSLNATLSGLQ